MIHNFDRSHWFGASDGKYIFQDYPNRSWNDWWKVKCGMADQNFYGNIYTKAGNTFEHSILKAFNPSIRFDRQIIIPELRLRVNLDGNTNDEIFEVKTYQIDKPFKVSEAYFYQAQLQMFAWENEQYLYFIDVQGCPKVKMKNPPLKKHTILAYGLYPDEYYGEYSMEDIEQGNIPIDSKRILTFEVSRSRGTIRQAKKRLRKLSQQLVKEEVYERRDS